MDDAQTVSLRYFEVAAGSDTFTKSTDINVSLCKNAYLCMEYSLILQDYNLDSLYETFVDNRIEIAVLKIYCFMKPKAGFYL